MSVDLEVYEHDTKSFTSGERKAVLAFQEAIHDSGLRDCFDSFTIEHVRWHETEFGPGMTRDMLREHAKMLNAWYLEVDRLLGDLLTCTSEATRYSTAAQRYVAAAADEYHRTRQGFEYTVTAWTLALPVDTVNSEYPPPTHAVNYFMQTLSTE